MGKLTLFYVLTLCAGVAVIVGVLALGASLPASAGSAVDATAGVTSTVGSSLSSLVEDGLGANLADPLSQLFLQLLVIIAAARGLGWLFDRLGQPAVVGEMLAGILLGPSLFGLVAPGAFAFVFPEGSLAPLGLLAQLGICLFMFTVGMELDVALLRRKASVALAVSHASIVVPFVLGVALAYFLYADLAAPGAEFTAFALFIGISMSITAFPVLARILRDRGMSTTPLGSTAITCAAVGDVTAWAILAFVVAVAGAAGLGGAVLTVVLSALFVGVMVLGVRRVLPRWLHAGGPDMDALPGRSDPSAGTLAIVACIVVASALATQVIGIHALFGAFLAGTIMPADVDFRRKLTVRLEYFGSVLLLPLFFAITGLRTQIGSLDDAQAWLVCLLIVAVASLGKLGGSAAAARVAGMRWNHALQLGALMNTRGLMELIALNIGYELGIVTQQLFTMLVIMALATTILTGPLLTLLRRRATATLDLG